MKPLFTKQKPQLFKWRRQKIRLPQPWRQKWRPGKKALAAWVLLAWLGFFFYQTTPPSRGPAPAVYVNVAPGMTAERIAALLYQQGLIRSVTGFRIVAQLMGMDDRLKAGGYVFAADMSTADIVDKLTRGETCEFQLTVPEGYTVDQIAALLQEKGVGDAAAFKKAARDFAPYAYMKAGPTTGYRAEGFLFPDTYRLENGVTERQILQRMARQFDREFTPAMRERAKEMGLSIRDVVTLASLVEKEARLEEDRPVIAGVFLNRIETRMALQSCATIQYILGQPKPELSVQDTRIASPYNTYLHPGLPPGPIANPGLASLQAVLHPQKTDYLYFVADRHGKHHFSRTYQEHLATIKKVQGP